jgi:deoxyribonuclease V
MRGPAVLDESVVAGHTGAGYRPGRLAMREGPLLERAARRLAIHPDVVFVNATGRDHPRGAGLALHLGAVLSVPTIGVTDRPLVATGTSSPGLGRGEVAFLGVNGSPVAVLVRTRAGVRPVVVHPGWRTDLATAVELVLSASGRARTPEPLRRARRLARLARAAAEGRIH